MTDSSAAIVTEICSVVGSKVPSYVVGQTSTRLVNAWARGDTEPDEKALEKLVSLRDAVCLLSEGEGPATIVSWMLGTNPMLNDDAPAEVLRGGDLAAFAQAARHFRAGG